MLALLLCVGGGGRVTTSGKLEAVTNGHLEFLTFVAAF